VIISANYIKELLRRVESFLFDLYQGLNITLVSLHLAE